VGVTAGGGGGGGEERRGIRDSFSCGCATGIREYLFNRGFLLRCSPTTTVTNVGLFN